MPDPAVERLSVVIPCYNEQDNVHRFPEEIFKFFQSYDFLTEFIAIDDGSKDRTYERLKLLQESEPHLTVIQHPLNRGLGAAIRSGINQATGDAILTIDSDLTFHPSEFATLWQAFDPGVDCVMGSPILGRMDEVSLIRQALSRGVNTMYNVLLGTQVTSTSSIFRLYRANKIKRLSLRSNSFDINAEILFQLVTSGSQVREVPVTLTTRTHGVSKINVAREIKNHLKMFAKIIGWRLAGGRKHSSLPMN